MNPPAISVILAVKNGERYIEQAINSVLDQTLKPIEILVIDGHSTDKTRKICSQFSEIKYIIQNGNGIPDAYNQGINTAEGDFISFISHDDLWKPEKLEKQINHMINDSKLQFTVTMAEFFLETGFECPAGFKKELFTKEQVAFIMETLVARKSVFDLIGMYDTSYSTGEDTDWFARAIDYKVPFNIVHETLVLKRIHDKNSALLNNENTRNLLKSLRKSIKRKRTIN